jgi:hypothetical protein
VESRHGAARYASLAAAVSVLVEYGLGVGVNLYVTVPAADRGASVAVAIGRAVQYGPILLAVHAVVGLVLVLGAVNLVVRCARSADRRVFASSVVYLIAIAGAAASGASFVGQQHPGASLAMALLAGLGLLCCLFNLYVLGSATMGSDRGGVAPLTETRSVTEAEENSHAK